MSIQACRAVRTRGCCFPSTVSMRTSCYEVGQTIGAPQRIPWRETSRFRMFHRCGGGSSEVKRRFGTADVPNTRPGIPDGNALCYTTKTGMSDDRRIRRRGHNEFMADVPATTASRGPRSAPQAPSRNLVGGCVIIFRESSDCWCADNYTPEICVRVYLNSRRR